MADSTPPGRRTPWAAGVDPSEPARLLQSSHAEHRERSFL